MRHKLLIKIVSQKMFYIMVDSYLTGICIPYSTEYTDLPKQTRPPKFLEPKDLHDNAV